MRTFIKDCYLILIFIIINKTLIKNILSYEIGFVTILNIMGSNISFSIFLILFVISS